MKFRIVPYVGAEPILFGMTSEQVERAMGVKARKFKKSSDSVMLTDAFDCCHVYYNPMGMCEAIEFFEPADLVLNDVTLIGKPYQEIEDFFKKADESIMVDDCGLTSNSFGIGVYAPFALSEPDEPVEGVIAFVKGYYDSI